MLKEVIAKIKQEYRDHVKECYDNWDGFDDIFLEKIDKIVEEEYENSDN